MGQTNSIYIPPGGTPSLTSTYVGVGNTDNQLSGTGDLTYDGTTFSVGTSGNPYLQATGGQTIIGDINNVNGDAKLYLKHSVGNNPGAITYGNNTTNLFIANGGSHKFGIGDGVDGTPPANHGTRIDINDITQTILSSNVPTYANDAAAIAGGLTTGMWYKTTVAGIPGVTFQCIVP